MIKIVTLQIALRESIAFNLRGILRYIYFERL